MRLARTVSRSLGTAGGIALTAALMASCGSSSVPGPGADADADRDGTSPAASCVAMVVYDDHAYYGRGQLQRDPETTGRVVSGTMPGCNDTGGTDEPAEAVALEELSDVPIETAVLFHDAVFVREGAQLPASTQGWFDVPTCQTEGEFDLTGDWLGVETTKKVRFDGDIRLPYTVELRVTDGPSEYLGATLQVFALESTSPSLTSDDVMNSLRQGGQVRAVTACNGTHFEAVSLSVPD